MSATYRCLQLSIALLQWAGYLAMALAEFLQVYLEGFPYISHLLNCHSNLAKDNFEFASIRFVLCVTIVLVLNEYK